MFVVIRCGGANRRQQVFVLVPNINNWSHISVLASYLFASFGTPILPSLVAMMLAASIGIAIFPDDGSCSTDLIKAADVAMYWAKAAWKHRFAFHSGEACLSINRLRCMETLFCDFNIRVIL